jgi:UDP-N-acetylglucosamine 2-epimerase (non-hydrolysing)
MGTRPEAIKLAPVIRALRARPDLFELSICSTGQHRELLHQALHSFAIAADIDLDLMGPDQTLPDLTSRLITGLSEVVVKTGPDIVLVQGDTATAFAGALAAYYAKVSVAHVEAGLRSNDRHNPFPEEANRRFVSAIADIHFAPTEKAAIALTSEGLPAASIHVTGNTVVDALLMLKDRLAMPECDGLVSPVIRALEDDSRPLILTTCHRRETFGEDLAAICRALKRLALAHPSHRIVFPVHLNPNVRAQVMPLLSSTSNLLLLEPVAYPDLIYLLSHSVLALSDSGGIQEEAPSFGVPVLVLRNATERTEGIAAGLAELVGANEQLIVDRADYFLSRHSRKTTTSFVNPYGDGRASERIVQILAQWS